MVRRSIEICYDIAAIPGGVPGDADRVRDFGNGAMTVIATALAETGAGQWEGAHTDHGRVNFGFSVGNFDKAEAIVRDAVAGTPYEHIRKINRVAFDPRQFE